MKAQVEQLAEMSETLESAGFSRPKSNAVIESVAMAMETFAVTPELLDDRIGGLRSRFDNRFNELESRFNSRIGRLDSRIDRFREETNKQFAAQAEDIKDLRQSVKRLEQAMFELKDTMFEFKNTLVRYMVGFTLLMLSAVAGVFGTVIARTFL